MRFDKAIYFVKETPGEYNNTTGDYKESQFIEELVYADVVDTSAKTLNLLFGVVAEGYLTIKIQDSYPEAFDYIKYNNKKYKVEKRRTTRRFETFVVCEVP